jgi:uncharacterized protein (DUF433 family)
MDANVDGKYIVADPRICHGKPTFRGSRIMVWQILEMLSEGMSWDEVTKAWGGRVPREAIAETLYAASKVFKQHFVEPPPDRIPA